MKSDRNNPMFMPYPNMNIPQSNIYPVIPGINELENRINSLERVVKRLDARISRLENSNGIYNTDSQYNTSIPDSYNQNIYPNTMHMM